MTTSLIENKGLIGAGLSRPENPMKPPYTAIRCRRIGIEQKPREPNQPFAIAGCVPSAGVRRAHLLGQRLSRSHAEANQILGAAVLMT